MQGFLIASITESGAAEGFFDGAGFNNRILEKARFFTEKPVARTALGNLQRLNGELDLAIFPATLTVELNQE